jgi:hypothetical protein
LRPACGALHLGLSSDAASRFLSAALPPCGPACSCHKESSFGWIENRPYTGRPEYSNTDHFDGCTRAARPIGRLLVG